MMPYLSNNLLKCSLFSRFLIKNSEKYDRNFFLIFCITGFDGLVTCRVPKLILCGLVNNTNLTTNYAGFLNSYLPLPLVVPLGALGRSLSF